MSDAEFASYLEYYFILQVPYRCGNDGRLVLGMVLVGVRSCF